MPYITYRELLARYPQFRAWHEGNESLVNSFCIAMAEAELNSRLATAYTVPFTTAYPVIKDLTFDLCYAKMMMSQNVEEYQKFYDNVIERINRLVNGDDLIYTDDGSTISPETGASSEIWSSTMDFEPTHSMLDAEHPQSAVDQNLVQYEENRR